MRWLYKRQLPILVAAVLLGYLVAARSGIVAADTANGVSLTISQVKLTSSNGQFITLYNSADTALDLGDYQLRYFNNYDLSRATSSRLIPLSGTVPPHGYFMIVDDSLLLCYQVTVQAASLGLATTAGRLELVALPLADVPGEEPVVQDYIAWSKTAASGAQTLPADKNMFLQRQPTDDNGNPIVDEPGSGSWLAVKPGTTDPCQLISSAGDPVPSGPNQLLASSEPPATIISASDGATGTTGMLPTADIGLMAPRLTELLPNPAGTGNDASDEYIELYNPNDTVFDLAGFALQTGTTSPHSYVFPAGTKLPANGFVAFYATTTGLSLSNSGGRAALQDPSGQAISQSETYGAAKDGQAWALANGKWYWTTTLTPGAANVIKAPVTAQPAKSAAKTAAAKTAAKTTAKKIAKAKAAKAAKRKSPAYSGGQAAIATTPVHTRVLALVAAAALLYGAYEYRADLANRIHQFKQYLRTRRTARPAVEGGRGAGAGQRPGWWQNRFRTWSGRRIGQP